MPKARGGPEAGGTRKAFGFCIPAKSRALAILEVLVHLTGVLPDKLVLGTIQIPSDLPCEHATAFELPPDWNALAARQQFAMRKIGGEWVRRGDTAVLTVPSVMTGERNILLNPEHSDFGRVICHNPIHSRLMNGF